MTSLNPTMNVGDQIVEGIRTHDQKSAAATRSPAPSSCSSWSAFPSPEERIKNYPHQLSGGMRQRVMIAIAIACSPDIIIADEPTTALDVTIQAQVLELLRELKDKLNTAFILVTHDLGIVFDFSDRIQVMYAGRIVERGTKHEIYKTLSTLTPGRCSIPSRGAACKARMSCIPSRERRPT